MRRGPIGLAALFATTLALDLASSKAGVLDDPNKFVGDHRAQVVFISVYSSADKLPSKLTTQGSGVLLKGGYVLTSLHLAPDIEENKGTTVFVTGIVGAHQGTELPLTYVDKQPAHDLLLLQFNPSISKEFSFACPRSKPITEPEPLAILGFPLDGSLSPSIGTISSLEPNEIRTTATIAPGNSGGPVYDDAGKLIGIVRGEKVKAGQGADFYVIVPISRARGLIAMTDELELGECGTGGPRLPNEEGDGPKTPLVDGIAETYVRLSGAFQVPIMMFFQEQGRVQYLPSGVAMGPINEPSAALEEVTPINNSETNVPGIDKEIAAFWESFEFRDAKPLATDLWNEMTDDIWIGHRLIVSAMLDEEGGLPSARSITTDALFCALSVTVDAPTQSERTRLKSRFESLRTGEAIAPGIINWIYARSAAPSVLRTGKISADAEKCNDRVSHAVGFKFHVFKNKTEVTMSDVTFTYREYPPYLTPDDFLKETQRVGADATLQEVINRPEFEQYRDSLDAGEVKTFRAPDLGPGEQVIWLTSVFSRTLPSMDREGPRLRNVTIPTSVRYKLADKEFEEPVLFAFRERKPIVDAPFGWFSFH